MNIGFMRGGRGGIRLFERLSAMLLYVMVLAFVVCAPCAAFAKEWHNSFGGTYDARVADIDLNSTNWMSGISGDRYLNEINIPGTHDAGCANVWCYHLVGDLFEDRAVTQKLYIDQQLNAGVRLLDLRVTDCGDGVAGHEDGMLYICHGCYHALGLYDGLYFCRNAKDEIIRFDTTMQRVYDYLKQHPSETIICTIKVEYADGEAEDVMKRIKQILDKHSDRIYTEDRIPQLKEVRGKAVIIGDDSNGKLAYGMQFGLTGTGSTTVGGMHTDFQNVYSVGGEKKVKEIKNFYESKNYRIPLNLCQHANQCLIVYTSANHLAGDNPLEVSQHVNPMAFGGENPLFGDKGRQFGWVYSDFVNQYMMRVLWESNFPDNLEYRTVTYTKHCGGAVVTKSERVLSGTNITVAPSDLLGAEGSDGWMLNGRQYEPGERMCVTKDVEFEAVSHVSWNEGEEMAWGDLQEVIDRADSDVELFVKLPHDLRAEDGDAPIVIDRRGRTTIDLCGNSIDANANAACMRRAFIVKHNADLVLRNGVLCGGCEERGSSIYVERPDEERREANGGLTLQNVHIRSNEATKDGGAVYLDGTHAGAATLKVSGCVCIDRNIGGDVYLCKDANGNGASIECAGKLDDVARIGVTLSREIGGSPELFKDGMVFTKGLAGKGSAASFESNKGARVIEKDGEAALQVACHTVTYVTDASQPSKDDKALIVRDGEKALCLEPEQAPQHAYFKCWCEDADLKKPFDFSAPITEDKTLYAKWEGDHAPKLVDRAEAERLGVKGAADAGDADVDATCTEAGSQTMLVVCEECKELLGTRQVSVPALGHDWGAWQLTREAADGHAGEEERICQRCQERETRLVPAADAASCAHEHLQHVAATEPTCSVEGAQEHYQCADCGHIFLDEACAQEASYDDLATQPLDHTEVWEDAYKQECGCAAHGHKLSVCCCADCGCLLDSKAEHGDPKGHSWDEGTSLYDATCMTDGIAVKTCAGCGLQQAVVIPQTGHDYQWDERQLPDAKGYVHRRHCCTQCGEVDQEETVAKPRFMEQHVALSGTVGLTTVVDLPMDKGESWDDSYMEFEVYGKHAHTVRVALSEAKQVDGTSQYAFTCPLSAIEMAQTVKATFHYWGDRTVVKEGLSLQDCIASNSSKDRLETQLVQAIADYGYHAQRFLSKKRGWKLGDAYAVMDSHFTEADGYNKEEILDALAGDAMRKNLGGAHVEKLTCSLVFGPTITMNLHFTVPSGTSLEGELEFNGATYTAERVSDTCYRISIPGIAASDLGESFIAKGTADGVFFVVGSPLSYVQGALASGKLGAEGDAALCALYKYYWAAKIFARS